MAQALSSLDFNGIYVVDMINGNWVTITGVTARIDSAGISYSGSNPQYSSALSWDKISAIKAGEELLLNNSIECWLIDVIKEGGATRFVLPKSSYGTDWVQVVDYYCDLWKSQSQPQANLAATTSPYANNYSGTYVSEQPDYQTPYQAAYSFKSSLSGKKKKSKTPIIAGAGAAVVALIVAALVLYFTTGSSGLTGPPQGTSLDQVARAINLSLYDVPKNFQSETGSALCQYPPQSPCQLMGTADGTFANCVGISEADASIFLGKTVQGALPFEMSDSFAPPVSSQSNLSSLFNLLISGVQLLPSANQVQSILNALSSPNTLSCIKGLNQSQINQEIQTSGLTVTVSNPVQYALPNITNATMYGFTDSASIAVPPSAQALIGTSSLNFNVVNIVIGSGRIITALNAIFSDNSQIDLNLITSLVTILAQRTVTQAQT
jgi:hypothetical protein